MSEKPLVESVAIEGEAEPIQTGDSLVVSPPVTRVQETENDQIPTLRSNLTGTAMTGYVLPSQPTQVITPAVPRDSLIFAGDGISGVVVRSTPVEVPDPTIPVRESAFGDALSDYLVPSQPTEVEQEPIPDSALNVGEVLSGYTTTTQPTEIEQEPIPTPELSIGEALSGHTVVSQPVELADLIIPTTSYIGEGGLLSGHDVSEFAEWDYLKKIIIAGSTDGVLTDYVVQVTVYFGSGADTGSEIFLGGKCKADFGDVRWINSDKTTELDYTLLNKVNGSYAVFAVKIASIAASPLSTNFYVHYGNANVLTTSNLGNTFSLFADDFTGVGLNNPPDTNKWILAIGDGSKQTCVTVQDPLDATNQVLYIKDGNIDGTGNTNITLTTKPDFDQSRLRFFSTIRITAWNDDRRIFHRFFTDNNVNSPFFGFLGEIDDLLKYRRYFCVGAYPTCYFSFDAGLDAGFFNDSEWVAWNELVNVPGDSVTLDIVRNSDKASFSFTRSDLIFDTSDNLVRWILEFDGKGSPVEANFSEMYIDFVAIATVADDEPTLSVDGTSEMETGDLTIPTKIIIGEGDMLSGLSEIVIPYLIIGRGRIGRSLIG